MKLSVKIYTQINSKNVFVFFFKFRNFSWSFIMDYGNLILLFCGLIFGMLFLKKLQLPAEYQPILSPTPLGNKESKYEAV